MKWKFDGRADKYSWSDSGPPRRPPQLKRFSLDAAMLNLDSRAAGAPIRGHAAVFRE